MPTAALKSLAKKADISIERAEHLWNKAKKIVSTEYPDADENYYSLVMGITKKMMGLNESYYEDDETTEDPESSLYNTPAFRMGNVIRILLMAQRCAHVHHWRVKSFSLHMALGELYDELTEFADELAEMYMGTFGSDINIPQSDPNGFDETDPVLFIGQLHSALKELEHTFPQEGFLVNKYQELQGVVSRIKYKIENLQ
jgi:VanZ family protein